MFGAPKSISTAVTSLPGTCLQMAREHHKLCLLTAPKLGAWWDWQND